MSSDVSEKTLTALARALRVAKLEAIVIGNCASMLNGAPVTAHVLIRPVARTDCEGRRRDTSGRRPHDVIRSKQAAGRSRDRAVLPILRDTLAVKKKLPGR